MEDLTMRSSKVSSVSQKVFKHEKLARASLQSYSLGVYRAQLLVFPKIKKSIFKNGKFITRGVEILKRDYIISAREYSEIFDVDISACYGILKRAKKNFIDSSISIEYLDSGKLRTINFCSCADYCKKTGTLKIRFTEEILPYLAQGASRYILYDLEEVSSFKSLFSVRLYELLQRFKYTGWAVAKVEFLREVFNTNKKLKKYNDFKRKTFQHATKEINRHHPDLELNFEEIKNGRRVESIKFFFKPAMKEIGKAIPDMSNIPELPPIPNLKPLDKGEVREKLRLAAERKKRRHQIAAQKQIEAITTSKEEEIALKFLKTGAPLEMVIEATGINRSRVMELQKIVESTNYNKSQVKL